MFGGVSVERVYRASIALLLFACSSGNETTPPSSNGGSAPSASNGGTSGANVGGSMSSGGTVTMLNGGNASGGAAGGDAVTGGSAGMSGAVVFDELSLADFYPTITAVICDNLERCCGERSFAFSRAACEQATPFMVAPMPPLMLDPSLVHDDAAAGSCVTQVSARAASCQDPWQLLWSLPECDDQFTGPTPLGGECGPGLPICTRSDDGFVGCYNGVCLAAATEAGHPCGPMFYPDNTTGFICEPEAGVFCDTSLAGGTCALPLAAGEVCDTHGVEAYCAGEAVCTPTEAGPRVCALKPGPGEPCTVQTGCAHALCDYDTDVGGTVCGELIPPPAAGDPCMGNLGDLACVGGVYVYQPRPRLGEACDAEVGCDYPGRCVRPGICVDLYGPPIDITAASCPL
jgi:hypothetical protein